MPTYTDLRQEALVMGIDGAAFEAALEAFAALLDADNADADNADAEECA